MVPTLVIEGSDLTKTYEGDVPVHALRGVSVQIEAASFVAITGPSGSGKSSLLHILGALEPPTSGRLLLEGVEIGLLSDDERTLIRRRRIGFVFQQFNLLPVFSTVENVAVPLRLEGCPAAESERAPPRALDMVGLKERNRHLPSQLSGGEQQRVAIARALVTHPAIILADEPTGNLDTANSDRLIAMLRELVDDAQTDRGAGDARSGRGRTCRPGDSRSRWSDQRRRCQSRRRTAIADFEPGCRGVAIMIGPRYALRELQRRPGRWLVSLFSVVVAVAAIVAVSSATGTTRMAYQQVFESLAGRADLEVVAHGGGHFEQRVQSETARLDGVRTVLPVFHRGTIIYAGEKKAKALAVGILPNEPESLVGLIVSAGRLPTGATEIAMQSSLAESLGLKLDATVRLLTSRGLRRYTVVGIVDPETAARLKQGGMVLARSSRCNGPSRRPGRLIRCSSI